VAGGGGKWLGSAVSDLPPASLRGAVPGRLGTYWGLAPAPLDLHGEPQAQFPGLGVELSREPLHPRQLARRRHRRAGRRGRHKRRTSPETAAWNREHLIPERPAWMPEETYRALARLRAELENPP
jgi:hypothetical protein